MDEPRDPEPQREPLLPVARRLGDLRVDRIGRGELRAALGRTALEVAGEVGYGKLTVERILMHGGASRAIFYRGFANAEACYLAGYETVIAHFVEGLLGRCRDAPEWTAGVRSTLDAFAEAVVASPVLANGLIVQVRAAGGAALEVHDTAFDQLASALDRGREVTPAGLTPPPNAADFVLGSIEAAAMRALSRREPREFAARTGDLAFLAVATYLGVDIARGQTEDE
jgi:hypothetical protein